MSVPFTCLCSASINENKDVQSYNDNGNIKNNSHNQGFLIVQLLGVNNECSIKCGV